MKQAAGVIILLIIAIFFYSSSINREHKAIENKVASMGGQVVTIEKTIFSNGPFFYRNKNGRIYKITYSKDNQTKVIWMRTKVFGYDWAE